MEFNVYDCYLGSVPTLRAQHIHATVEPSRIVHAGDDLRPVRTHALIHVEAHSELPNLFQQHRVLLLEDEDLEIGRYEFNGFLYDAKNNYETVLAIKVK